VAGHDGKTEKATPQRRTKARKEGQIARSQEVGVAVSLAAGAMVLKVFGPQALDTMRNGMSTIFSNSGTDHIPTQMLGTFMGQVGLGVITPFLAAGVVAAVVGNVAQTGFSVSTKAAKPKLSHLSPKKGLDRLKPQQASWELVRSVGKLGLLAAVIWGPLMEFTNAAGAQRDVDAVIGRTLDMAWTVLLRTVLLMGVIAAIDYAYNRRKLNKNLMMSKEEIKQESKDSDGDPHIKGQRRRRAMELSRNRMLGEVAAADVVVVNPTHIAVALRYGDGDAAPRVVAKGADRIAAKIRKEAYRHGVLVTRDVPLARTLYRRCKVGSYVPAALYEAVAVVLALAYRRYGKVAA
jgi:flagellar biosynthesis protein FlhB